MPDTEESASTWRCERCGKDYKITAKVFGEWINSDRVRRGPEFDAKQVVFRCDVCRTYSVVRTGRCAEHNIWYVTGHSDPNDHTPTYCTECLKAQGGGG